MSKFKYIVASLCVSLLGVSLPAGATVIDFNSAPTFPGGGNFIGPTYTEDGYELSVPNGANLLSLPDGAQNGRFSSNGTTTAYGVFDPGESVQLSRVGGGSFNLQSIDVAEVFNNGDSSFPLVARTVFFTGTRDTNDQVFTSFDLDLISDGVGGAEDFETVFFSVFWENIVSLDITVSGGSYLNFDNITLSQSDVTVPEPGMLALFGFGIAAIGYGRRKRRT